MVAVSDSFLIHDLAEVVALITGLASVFTGDLVLFQLSVLVILASHSVRFQKLKHFRG